ncbi:hypothetical protein Tco_1393348 [Tanacetum coccineum]
MILNIVQNGPLVWPIVVEENDTTRKKKYKELSFIEEIQANCDLKATNIVLQGLPSDVYAIVNHHKVAKEIGDRVKLLMQGTKLSLQEKECKLYDKFDKFLFVKGETLYQYYWRFAQLINNMNDINMSIRPIQTPLCCNDIHEVTPRASALAGCDKEVIKLLGAGLIYPISDSPWVSPVHCVPKKGGITVVENEDNELIPTRLVTGWRVCIDYRKLNDATRGK